MKKIIPLILATILIGCNQKIEDRIDKSPAASIPVSVTDDASQMELEATSVIWVQGMVDIPPNHLVSIQPYFEGYISDIMVFEGSKVKKGDLLFKLTNPDFITIQEDYWTDKATVDYLEKMLKRTSALHAEKVTPDQDLEQMEMDYKIAKANLEAVTRTLRLMNLPVEKVHDNQLFESINIYSPIPGFVGDLDVTSGEFIQKGREVMSVINSEHIHLELKVFEKDLKYISEGQPINYRIPEISAEPFEAKIYLIGKSVDPQTRMIDIHAHVQDAQLELLPGMFVEAEIKIDVN